ncbi:MAG: uroporphyrinogen-III C-methyltransferase [Hydrogenophilaceae bacterium]|jgi:uroporphyrin-III C-methyltransferase/precorrin-2 dehydrogenase/sirohydrochlorin ferrochelatase|nr:uroporphyrinogen-III C-methyltransferase [Hydrogenophilaceae bacterium]
MQSFPAFFPLEGRRIAVIGEGPMADAKARLFAGSPAAVERFAQTPESLAGFSLVFVALADEAGRAGAVAVSKRDGVPVNVVDGPALSDFYTPAIVDRGELVIGVSTSGAAPTLARDLRARIEAIVPAAYAQVAAFARRIRARVLARRSNFEGRRRAWEAILRGAPGERALAGDLDAAEALAEHVLEGAAAAAGVVHLVGAGPGDPELLTLRALRVLQDADIVFHDKLVDPRVLDLIRRDAERVFVGKARGDHAVPQREIEARLIAEAQKGRRVVRLKGGDPFVFGRGGEELEALRAAGVEAHVVPGITAALGCAAEIGVPLTHRDHAQAVTFVTGHAKDGAPDLDWAALANAKQTVVVYMGVDTAAHTAANLIAAGRAASTPALVIENGTTPKVKRARGALCDLPALIAQAGILGPAILIIGEVAALADVAALALAEQAA